MGIKKTYHCGQRVPITLRRTEYLDSSLSDWRNTSSFIKDYRHFIRLLKSLRSKRERRAGEFRCEIVISKSTNTINITLIKDIIDLSVAGIAEMCLRSKFFFAM